MIRKFTIEKFTCLPMRMRFGRGILVVDETKIDMIPAGLKGVKAVIFGKKPSFIAPDFEGCIVCSEAAAQRVMTEDEIKEAKDKYTANKKIVEEPRYIEEDDGTLSLCSLPKNIKVILKPYDGYYLDLTHTDVIEEPNVKGFRGVILYPKKVKGPQNICSYEKHPKQQSTTKNYE